MLRAWRPATVNRILGIIILVAIVLVVAAGFWLTRGAGGPRPLDAEGRKIDAMSHVGPRGDPMSFDDDFKHPR